MPAKAGCISSLEWVQTPAGPWLGWRHQLASYDPFRTLGACRAGLLKLQGMLRMLPLGADASVNDNSVADCAFTLLSESQRGGYVQFCFRHRGTYHKHHPRCR